MTYILWLISFLSTIFAFFYYNSYITTSAPQQAALAAVTLVIIILPYCLARAATEYHKHYEHKLREHKEAQRDKEIYSRLTDHFILNKILTLYSITNIEPLNTPTYQQIMHRIDYLKELCDDNLISIHEFEKTKKYLYSFIEQFSKQ